MKITFSLLSSFLFIAFSSFTFADCIPDHVDEDADLKPESISIFFDQDMFLKTDRDYTMGLEFSLAGGWIYKAPVFCQMATGLHFLNSLFKDYEGVAEYYQSASIGDTAFTPKDISDPDPIFDDRPYANLLYTNVAEVKVKEINENVYLATSSKLVIGVLGLNLGRDVQTWIHEEISNSPNPLGWSNQISDGGELTGLYHRSHMRNYNQSQEISWFFPEITTYVDYSLGYYAETGFGGLARLGFVNSQFYEHLSNPIATGNHFAANGDLYLFADGGIKLNLYNAMLQGQFADSAVTYEFDELNHFFYQYSLGGVFGVNDKLALSYVYHYRSPQLKSGPGVRPHKFSGLYLSYKWVF